jgi:hypothetical protein
MARRFKIPSAFTMGTHRWTVKQVSQEKMDELTDDVECYGVCMPDELAIYLVQPSRAMKRSIVVETFWHEYAHALLWSSAGKWKDEKLVDAMSKALKQSHETWEY